MTEVSREQAAAGVALIGEFGNKYPAFMFAVLNSGDLFQHINALAENGDPIAVEFVEAAKSRGILPKLG